MTTPTIETDFDGVAYLNEERKVPIKISVKKRKKK
jgi:hypothetical protein